MAYCNNCGGVLDSNEKYCSICGKDATASEREDRHTTDTQSSSDGEKFCNALAYVLPMFWVPLMVYPNNQKARHNANQGLWLLITTIITALLSRVLYIVFALATGVVDTSSIYLLFRGSFAWDYISNNLFLLLPTTINALFVVISGIVGFVRCLQDKICRIPGFSRLKLINSN